jgi:DNA-directed RNA polymerase specialized sigma24 family protein
MRSLAVPVGQRKTSLCRRYAILCGRQRNFAPTGDSPCPRDAGTERERKLFPAGAVANRGSWRVLWSMGVTGRVRSELVEFTTFVRDVEPKLLHALVAHYGPVDGREATVDALSWAWENWARLADVDNKLGYLYRVGQSATRRYASRPVPRLLHVTVQQSPPDIDPGLLPALARLSEQQRTAVVLVHAFGWTQTEVAHLLDVTVSTVREHITRGLSRLRAQLEVSDAS